MEKIHFRVHISSILVLILLLSQFPGDVLGNWGYEVGRANGGDVLRLANDWNAFKRERDRIESVFNLKDTVMLERQRQIMGVAAENWGPQQLFEELQDYWLSKVMAPLQSVALNPAASCAEARFSLATLGRMRQ